jgi:hypothetical protein
VVRRFAKSWNFGAIIDGDDQQDADKVDKERSATSVG